MSGYLPQPPIKHLRPGQTPIRSSAPQVKAPRSLAPINDVGRIGSGVRVSASFPKNARVVRYNKCIEDDTKAAAHQSPNCISNKNSASAEVADRTLFTSAHVEYLAAVIFYLLA